MDDRVARLGNRTDTSAAHERDVAAHFAEWLDQNQHNDRRQQGIIHEPDA
jgi:hypothetical protein